MSDAGQVDIGSEVPPDDPNLVKIQVEADLLKENLEEQRIKNSQQRSANKFRKSEYKHIKKNRRKYSRHILSVTIYWLLFCAVCIVGTAFKNDSFNLSDGVIIAMIGSALGTVVGMLVVILNWLYPKSKD
ncbi:hypothetical protein [Deinococcus saxicola]|uniref:hypothetical protein n=1 Tax=Deinococcus saxicola TaxID=249406 RepID=UPI0039EF7017